MSQHPYERRILELSLALPEIAAPAGSYQPVVISGNTAYLSGQLSRRPEGGLITGKVGQDLDKKAGQDAAHAAALNLIAVIKSQIGFERFGKILKINGYVQTAPDFHEISAVMNAASDLLALVFGSQGIHARTSVGMASLPLNAAVEIDAVIELKNQ